MIALDKNTTEYQKTLARLFTMAFKKKYNSSTKNMKKIPQGDC